jgi:Mrp family chromosome partitioning ATPase/capsular polysaccharide biosynthesis protein
VASQDLPTAYDLEPGTRERPSLLSVLRRRFLIILVVPLLAGGAAAALVFTGDDTYESTAKLLFRQTIPAELNSVGLLPSATDPDNLANSNVAVVGSRRVADATAADLRRQGIDVSTDDVINDVSVSTTKDSDVVDVVASASSAQGAATLAQTYAQNAVDISQRQQRRRAERALRVAEQQLNSLDPEEARLSQPRLIDYVTRLRVLVDGGVGSPELIQAGFVPTERSGTPVRTIGLAVLFGFVLGIGLALLREQADRRLHRAEDVSAAYDARVLTTVPRHRALKRRQAFEDLPQDVAEAFRMLFVNLRYVPGRRPRTVLVTSSHSKEGKTTIAWHLASAAAAGGLNVVVVEADMRRPQMAKRYGLETGPGLAEVLGGTASVNDALQIVGGSPADQPDDRHPQRLQALVAGTPSVDSWVLMQSGVMDRTLRALMQRHDLVVLDTPPIPYVADAVSLLPSVDGVLVVASMSSTKGPEAARLRDQLATFEAPVLGVVANRGSAVAGYSYAPTVSPRADNGNRGDTVLQPASRPPELN